MSDRDVHELKEALEYQIDIVLRLEEQRIALVKENKIQKQKINELSILIQKYSCQIPKEMKSIEIQTDFDYQDYQRDQFATASTQTEDIQENKNDEEILDNDSVFQYSHYSSNEIQLSNEKQNIQALSQSKSKKSSILQEAESLLYTTQKKQQQDLKEQDSSFLNYTILQNNINENTNASILNDKRNEVKQNSNVKKNLTSRMPIKNLQFKKKNDISIYNKENSIMEQSYAKNDVIQEQQNKQKQENEIIAKELVKLTREQNHMKKEARRYEEEMKKREKEILEQQKMIDVKNQMLEKLRIEVAELSLLINNDKFKSIKAIENELKKQKQQYQDLKTNYEQNQIEKKRSENELHQFRQILEKLTLEYNNLQSNDMSFSLKQQQIQQQNQINELQKQILKKNEEVQRKNMSVEEMKKEVEKMVCEIEYFKNISITSKNHANKALDDVDFYRNILLKNNLLPL